jgi:hypothetical protein
MRSSHSQSQADSAPQDELPLWAHGPHGLHLAEIPTREGGRLPTFLVIGAAKCGTTALSAYLDQHPDVAMCPYKEPHFFSTDVLFERGLDWYKGLFAGLKPAKACGGASTSYSRAPEYPATAQRIHAAMPDARLVYIVREPVSRTESDILQAVKYARHALGRPASEIDLEALLAQNPVAIHSSEYIVQIRMYLEFFPRDRLLVLLQSDLRDDPHGTLAKIFAHIEVDPAFRVELAPPKNATSDFVDGLRDERVVSLLRRVPGYGTIRTLIPSGMKQRIKQMMLGFTPPTAELKFTASTRASLHEHFRPFNEELAEFLGRDLSHWDRGPRPQGAST